jgi:hypothetical protein
MKTLLIGILFLISFSVFAGREFIIKHGVIDIYRVNAFEGKEFVVSVSGVVFSQSKSLDFCGLKFEDEIIKCFIENTGADIPAIPFIYFKLHEATKFLELTGVIASAEEIIQLGAPLPDTRSSSYARTGHPLALDIYSQDYGRGLFYYNQNGTGIFSDLRDQGEFYYPLQLLTADPINSFEIEFIEDEQ